jgi:electron-transferring-flavoprotein dehydrogenase
VQRETLEFDVLIVGGGPAGLSAALRLAQLQKQSGAAPLSVAVLEKAREAGAHMLSGAVLDPSTLRDLIPDFKNRGAPLASEVQTDHVYFFTRTAKIPFPIIPPPLQNHGNYVVSLNEFVRWLSEQVEAEGVDIFTGFSGQDVLMHGEPRATSDPGVDIQAKVTIFCDGVRGNLTKTLLHKLDLCQGRAPEQFAIGIKELWQLPEGRLKPGTVMHTMGYPLKHEEFGGAFIYALPDRQACIGFVAGLDYKDPLFDPHMAFNRFKQHPFMSALLQDGEMLRYGAKALPEGGWHTIPRVYMDGGLIAGDAGGFMNSMRLKGIHLAMRTGMLAAETAFEAVRADDTSAAVLRAYQTTIDASRVRKELYPVRNVHQAFGYGLLPGLMHAGLAVLTGGWWIKGRVPSRAGHERMERIDAYHGSRQKFVLTFDKVTNVHYSGTTHEEDQSVHLLVNTDVCHSTCGEEYGHPCVRFCPANVYEMVDDGQQGKKLQINASNCVHCKACDIMDPYAAITWVPPEGGGGPQYNGM